MGLGLGWGASAGSIPRLTDISPLTLTRALETHPQGPLLLSASVDAQVSGAGGSSLPGPRQGVGAYALQLQRQSCPCIPGPGSYGEAHTVWPQLMDLDLWERRPSDRASGGGSSVLNLSP